MHIHPQSIAPLTRPRLNQGSQLLLVLGSFLCMQCGGKTVDREANPLEPSAACSNQLGSKPISHACTHTTNGPFQNVVAAESADAAPKVDAVHVSYLIDIPEAEETVFVEFTPSRNGEHLLLLNHEVPFTVELGSVREQPVFRGSLEGCDTASYGEVFDLSARKPYTIAFEANGHSSTLLFFEHLATFGNGAWEEACLDGE